MCFSYIWVTRLIFTLDHLRPVFRVIAPSSAQAGRWSVAIEGSVIAKISPITHIVQFDKSRRLLSRTICRMRNTPERPAWLKCKEKICLMNIAKRLIKLLIFSKHVPMKRVRVNESPDLWLTALKVKRNKAFLKYKVEKSQDLNNCYKYLLDISLGTWVSSKTTNSIKNLFVINARFGTKSHLHFIDRVAKDVSEVYEISRSKGTEVFYNSNSISKFKNISDIYFNFRTQKLWTKILTFNKSNDWGYKIAIFGN